MASVWANRVSSPLTVSSYAFGRFNQLRIGLLHHVPHGVHHVVHEWAISFQPPAVPDCAADDFAKHVAATFVRRQHAIGNQECAARAWSAITRSEAAW